jgi:hypothetical protein
LGQALSGIDELGDAEQIATAALDAARPRGSSQAYALASYHRAIPRYHRGDLMNALADLDQSDNASGDVWTAGAGWLRSLQVHLLPERGELAAAGAAFNLAPPPTPSTMDVAIVRFAQSRLTLAQRDHSSAHAHAQTAGTLLMEGFGIDHPGLLPWRNVACLAAAALGRRDEAESLANDGLQRAQACPGARALGHALHHAALVNDGDGLLCYARRVSCSRRARPGLHWVMLCSPWEGRRAAPVTGWARKTSSVGFSKWRIPCGRRRWRRPRAMSYVLPALAQAGRRLGSGRFNADRATGRRAGRRWIDERPNRARTIRRQQDDPESPHEHLSEGQYRFSRPTPDRAALIRAGVREIAESICPLKGSA